MAKFEATISAIICGDDERQIPCGIRLSMTFSLNGAKTRNISDRTDGAQTSVGAVCSSEQGRRTRSGAWPNSLLGDAVDGPGGRQKHILVVFEKNVSVN